MCRIALLLLSVSFSVHSFAQTDTLFYSVVKGGTISGQQKSWQTGPNEYHYRFYFNDRGRGNDMNVVVGTDEDGLITSLHSNGVDYYKNPYLESFRIDKDSAVWNVNDDRKTKKFDRQLYNSVTAPGISELQINYVLKTPGQKNRCSSGSFDSCQRTFETSLNYNGKSLSPRTMQNLF